MSPGLGLRGLSCAGSMGETALGQPQGQAAASAPFRGRGSCPASSLLLSLDALEGLQGGPYLELLDGKQLVSLGPVMLGS